MTCERPEGANILSMVGLLLLGGCQKQLSLQAMQPLHQQQDIIAARLATARGEGLCAGAMLLSTCNRFEVVFGSQHRQRWTNSGSMCSPASICH